MKYILQFSQSVVLLVTRCPPPWSCWALKASQSRLWHLTLNHPPFPSFRFHANMCCHLWVPALIMKCCSSPSVLDYLHKARKWSDMGEGVCLKSHCYWSERVLVVDAEHHLMHISLEPTRSLASTTFFFFFFAFLGSCQLWKHATLCYMWWKTVHLFQREMRVKDQLPPDSNQCNWHLKNKDFSIQRDPMGHHGQKESWN